MADAVASVARRFWADDAARIASILRRRARQLAPCLRRLLAHATAFAAGVTHLRRALAACARVLNSDARVRALLRRVGWASAAALRAAVAVLAAVLAVAVRAHDAVRHRLVPAARTLLPTTYARVVHAALRTARRSPWALVLGPASLTLALHAAALPDPWWLHRKFGVGTRPKDKDPFDPLAGWDFAALLAGGGAGSRGGSRGGSRPHSLSYEYTYGTGTINSRAAETEPCEAAGDTGSYYYAYDTQGSYGGGDRGLSSVAGTERAPFGAANAQDGRKNVLARTKAEERRAREDKENDRRRSVADDGLEFGDYDEAGNEYDC